MTGIYGIRRPIVLANVGTAGNIAVGDFTGDGRRTWRSPTRAASRLSTERHLTLTSGARRNLGDAEHVVTQTQAIVTGDESTDYTYTSRPKRRPAAVIR